jgi:SAM-dependent methyltransferase
LLHLACGAGGFLVQMARSDVEFRGIGIDKLPEKIAGAEEKIRRYQLESRLRVMQAEIGAEPLPLGEEERGQIDVVASIYLLHEIGRYGRQRIVDLLREIKQSFPGKLFLFSETMPPETPDSVKKPPSQYAQLDYLLIHRLRGKGMPLHAEEWKSILADAEIKLIDYREVYSIGLFLAEL